MTDFDRDPGRQVDTSGTEGERTTEGGKMYAVS